jgi:exopolysaccharide production protein ExoQ
MIPRLIALVTWAGAIWLIRRDTAQRQGVSSALWIPTLWIGILLSRPMSAWLGWGGGAGGAESMEGSPVDALFYFLLIIASAIVLNKRQVNWGEIISASWPVFLFYGYLLVTVIWAESPIVSFKRWFKDFGNIVVALVILTEANPQQALRAVILRCAYIFIPLSVVFIRYFPELGRRYNTHSGNMEPMGVTFQKNYLGVLVLICSLVIIWDWIERSQAKAPLYTWIDRWLRYLPIIYLSIGAYLLRLCDSKTSIAALILGGSVLLSAKMPFLRQRIGAIGGYTIAAVAGFWTLDWLFGIKESIIGGMGRDMTFTGRTDVWRVLLKLNTDPIVGTGFCSFWSDKSYLSKLPDWVAFSAHNGYLETYIDGGMIAVSLLVLMLLAVGLRLNKRLAVGGNYALFCFAVLLVTIIANFSESHFGRMTPLGFLFLLVAVDSRSDKIAHYKELAPVPLAPGDIAA